MAHNEGEARERSAPALPHCRLSVRAEATMIGVMNGMDKDSTPPFAV
jgi:hypothetical protein